MSVPGRDSSSVRSDIQIDLGFICLWWEDRGGRRNAIQRSVLFYPSSRLSILKEETEELTQTLQEKTGRKKIHLELYEKCCSLPGEFYWPEHPPVRAASFRRGRIDQRPLRLSRWSPATNKVFYDPSFEFCPATARPLQWIITGQKT